MSDSIYQALFTAVYVVIFIAAATITVSLFNTTITYAEDAYNYGKITSNDSVIETTAFVDSYNVISGTEMLTYYYNYVENNKYGTTSESKYVFDGIDGIEMDENYILEYASTNSSTGITTIKVTKTDILSVDVDSDSATSSSNDPSIPNVWASKYDLDENIPAKTLVTFYATSQVTVSPITNSIQEYKWTVSYNGVQLTSYTSSGTEGTFSYTFTNNEAEYILTVTAIDKLGNESTKTITITTGYLTPTVAIYEANSKVISGGSVNINSEFGANLNFKASANSNNPSGSITSYQWSVNGVKQSETSSTLNYTFEPGYNNVSVIVTDSFGLEKETNFYFTVNEFPSPNIISLTETNIGIESGSKVMYNSGGVYLKFLVYAEPSHDYATITKYEWYVDGVLQKSSLYTFYNQTFDIGSHTVLVKVYDSKDNSTSKTFNFTIAEVEAPTITTNPSASNDTIIAMESGNTTFKLKAYSNLETFYNSDNVTYVWKINGTSYTTNSSSNWVSYNISSSTSYLSVEVYAIDSNGQKSPTTTNTYQFKQKVIDNIIINELSTGNFDIVGVDNGTNIKTTYSNNGYASTYWVNGTMYSSNSSYEEHNGVVFTRTVVYDGYDVTITHTATNNSTSNKTIDISLDSDIMIYNNDSATVTSDGNSIYMTDGTYTFYFRLKNSVLVDDVTTFWYGHYNSRTSYRLKQLSPLNDLTSTDSGMAFSWQDIVLSPGETQSFTVIMGLV